MVRRHDNSETDEDHSNDSRDRYRHKSRPRINETENDSLNHDRRERSRRDEHRTRNDDSRKRSEPRERRRSYGSSDEGEPSEREGGRPPSRENGNGLRRGADGESDVAEDRPLPHGSEDDDDGSHRESGKNLERGKERSNDGYKRRHRETKSRYKVRERRASHDSEDEDGPVRERIKKIEQGRSGDDRSRHRETEPSYKARERRAHHDSEDEDGSDRERNKMLERGKKRFGDDRSRHRENGRNYKVKERRHDSDEEDDFNRERRKKLERGRERQRDRSADGKMKIQDDVVDRKTEVDRSYKDREERVGRPRQDENSQKPPETTSTQNLGKTGGIYIPPYRMARMMNDIEDKSSPQYQRLTWDALRKSINGLVNKVNASNIKNIIPELFAENLIRGRGLFCRSCMKSQMASPGFTDVFAALTAVVNTKFPEVGDLLLRRIILQLKRSYKRNDKPQLLAVVKYIAHLVNQQVAHELIALQLLEVLLENPTDDSVEVAVGFVTECGSILQDLSPKGLHAVFERFRGILHEGEIDKRVQFLIEGLFAIRKAKFQGFPAVRPELDLVEQEDQLTHEVSLDEEIDPEITLDMFKPDPDFLENEKRYEELKKTILGEDSEDESGSDAGSDDEDEDDDEDDDEEEDEEQMKIKDETETNLVNLRRTIYLTIMSSVDFEESGHKLLKIKLEPGQEMELCIMLLECCSQERTYLRYYGLLGQRFCMINKVHQDNFEKCFVQQYSMIHRLETNKLRNVAKFFAHLLGTDALPWDVLAYIRLTEEDTTSSSRIFIKILFQELSEHLGIRLLNERLNDPSMQVSLESIFPRDNPKNTRFSINFFTSIGLGGITENLREYLKNMPRLIMQQREPVSESDGGSGSSSSGSDTSSSESESSSQSDSGSGDRGRSRKRRRGE